MGTKSARTSYASHFDTDDTTNNGETLAPTVTAFLAKFPEGRVCRLINRCSGTLLDVRSLNLHNDAVPKVVGNPESAGVRYWMITPYGDGQAIIAIPRDGSRKIRYLTPSSLDSNVSVTLSPFPTSWVIMPTSECPAGGMAHSYKIPKGLEEEWTCRICWPHSRNDQARMLDLWHGMGEADTPVVIYNATSCRQQYWLIQFIQFNNGQGKESFQVPPYSTN